MLEVGSSSPFALTSTEEERLGVRLQSAVRDARRSGSEKGPA